MEKSRYLISSRRFRLSHTFHEIDKGGKESRGRDRTFSKLGDCDAPISYMLCSGGSLPFELENNPDIQDLKYKRFFGGIPTNIQNNAV